MRSQAATISRAIADPIELRVGRSLNSRWGHGGPGAPWPVTARLACSSAAEAPAAGSIGRA